MALVPKERRATARGLVAKITEAASRLQKPGNQEAITITNLQQVVTEAVKAAVKAREATSPARTWADVATGAQVGAPGSALGLPQKVVPQRANREILIRGRDLPADLAKRTPAEITQAVNQASAQQGAIAARKMPSGDTVVTFRDPAAKEWYSKNPEWIQQAFGEQAKAASTTHAVLVKGLRKADLTGVSEEAFGREAGL